MTMIKGIDKSDWANFLRAFSERNHGRRARFEFFIRTNVQEEGEEGHLESVSLETEGKDAPRVVVKRCDESGIKAEAVIGAVPNVRRLSVQYDTDNSEDALEIEDTKGVLVILRMESKVDGAS